MLAATIIAGHLILLIGLRIYFGYLFSERPESRAFLKTRKFKLIATAYITVVASAIVGPVLLYMW